MNFTDLCEFAAEEVNGRPLTFSSVLLTSVTDPFQRRVIKGINKAYMDIQLYSRFWRFLNKRGALLNIKTGVTEYRLTQVQTIDYSSLYLTKSGTTARWPIYEEPYNDWQMREQVETSSDGIPLNLIRASDPDKWHIWPSPIAAYVLNGNLQYKPGELEIACDEPIWDTQYHQMVAWLAVKQLEARVKTQDEIVSNQNTRAAGQLFQADWVAFCAQYLPYPGDK